MRASGLPGPVFIVDRVGGVGYAVRTEVEQDWRRFTQRTFDWPRGKGTSRFPASRRTVRMWSFSRRGSLQVRRSVEVKRALSLAELPSLPLRVRVIGFLTPGYIRVEV